MKNNQAIQRFFKVFEVLATFILLNLIMFLGSVISLFILTPLLVFSMFKTIGKLTRKDFDDMLVEYFTNMKHRFVKVTKVGYPLILGIAFLLYLFLVVNPYIADIVPIYLYAIIMGAQLLLLYMIISVTMIYLMKMAIDDKEDNPFRSSILLVFGYPGKTIFAFLSMFFVPGLLLYISYFFIFLIIPFGLIGYYIMIAKTLEEFLKNT